MTKEEYEEKLAKQFEEEETLTPAPTAQTTPATEDASTPSTEPATAPEGETPSADTAAAETPADGSAEGDTASTADAPETDESAKGDEVKAPKYSNRHVKKMEWENKTLKATLAKYEERLKQLEAKGEAPAPKMEKPVRGSMSDDEYIDRAIAYRLNELAEGAREKEAADAKRNEDFERNRAEFQRKFEAYVPEARRSWLNDEVIAHYADLETAAGGAGSPTMTAILESEKAPVILAECFKNPNLVSALAGMNEVERRMTIWKVCEDSKIFADTKTAPAPAASAPVQIVGKVGGGAAGGAKPVEQMTDDELYAAYLKQM
jgi:hypothetical protein